MEGLWDARAGEDAYWFVWDGAGHELPFPSGGRTTSLKSQSADGSVADDALTLTLAVQLSRRIIVDYVKMDVEGARD